MTKILPSPFLPVSAISLIVLISKSKFLLEIAKIIKKKRINIKIYFCGKTDNYKNQNHFKLINDKIYKLKLDKIIKNFGEVSVKQLNKLQKECLAFVNPSLYEGWSTINEEARSNLKYIFLSDISGHREQNNYGSIYFNLNSPNNLSLNFCITNPFTFSLALASPT